MKVFSYHYLYTTKNLLADIGGYLGLFTGLSIFSLVRCAEGCLKRRNRKKGPNEAEKTDEAKKMRDEVSS